MKDPFRSEQAARFQMLDGIGYFAQMQRLARISSVAFWWHGQDEKQGRYRILHNGTVCFVNTGKRVIGVSAAHVYRGYCRDKERYGSFGCQFGNSTIEPEKYVLDENKELDLVTFELSSVLLAATGVSEHGPKTWPPEELRAGEVVICGGYPGLLREERAAEAEIPFANFSTKVLSSSPENITLHIDLANIDWGSEVRPHERGLVDYGGMSGGPIYRIRETPVEHLELVGFIYESSIKAPTQEEPNPMGFILGRHAWRVDAEGRIQT